MRFSRDWEPVEDALTTLWLDASDPQAITDAANNIDRLLANDAHLLGESRDGATRIAFSPPLGILFDVSVAEKHVLVWRIWRTDS